MEAFGHTKKIYKYNICRNPYQHIFLIRILKMLSIQYWLHI